MTSKGGKKLLFRSRYIKRKKKIKRRDFNSVGFDINILCSSLANIFVVLPKTHKTVNSSPKR